MIADGIYDLILVCYGLDSEGGNQKAVSMSFLAWMYHLLDAHPLPPDR